MQVRLFMLPHRGKGATLNALAVHARHEVLLTVDADTTPAPEALALMARAFVDPDPDVDSGTGAVWVRNGRQGWLLANQSAEYLKNTCCGRFGGCEVGSRRGPLPSGR